MGYSYGYKRELLANEDISNAEYNSTVEEWSDNSNIVENSNIKHSPDNSSIKDNSNIEDSSDNSNTDQDPPDNSNIEDTSHNILKKTQAQRVEEQLKGLESQEIINHGNAGQNEPGFNHQSMYNLQTMYNQPSNINRLENQSVLSHQSKTSPVIDDYVIKNKVLGSRLGYVITNEDKIIIVNQYYIKG